MSSLLCSEPLSECFSVAWGPPILSLHLLCCSLATMRASQPFLAVVGPFLRLFPLPRSSLPRSPSQAFIQIWPSQWGPCQLCCLQPTLAFLTLVTLLCFIFSHHIAYPSSILTCSLVVSVNSMGAGILVLFPDVSQARGNMGHHKYLLNGMNVWEGGRERECMNHLLLRAPST